MKPSSALLIALVAFVGQANASSTDAWKALDKTVVDSCIKASQLKSVKPLGKAGFDDSVGYEAMMLEGRYPQPHMKNQPGTELCLYNRHSKKATVTEWNTLTPTPKK
ncbi:hypothetical protein [Pseudomonas sp. DWP3-1-2]|uniref:hypothetical protein n=1 Tax=Pseudomonas sp. DWP3-1-2 TaxID=2804645 RepID=UPI003CF9A579